MQRLCQRYSQEVSGKTAADFRHLAQMNVYYQRPWHNCKLIRNSTAEFLIFTVQVGVSRFAQRYLPILKRAI